MGPERKPAEQSGHTTGDRVAGPRWVGLIATATATSMSEDTTFVPDVEITPVFLSTITVTVSGSEPYGGPAVFTGASHRPVGVTLSGTLRCTTAGGAPLATLTAGAPYTLDGIVAATGAAALSLCGVSIGGSLSITASKGPVIIGPSGCSNVIKGPVAISNNTGGGSYNGNTVSGSLAITNNSGGFTYHPATNNTLGSVVGTVPMVGAAFPRLRRQRRPFWVSPRLAPNALANQALGWGSRKGSGLRPLL